MLLQLEAPSDEGFRDCSTAGDKWPDASGGKEKWMPVLELPATPLRSESGCSSDYWPSGSKGEKWMPVLELPDSFYAPPRSDSGSLSIWPSDGEEEQQMPVLELPAALPRSDSGCLSGWSSGSLQEEKRMPVLELPPANWSAPASPTTSNAGGDIPGAVELAATLSASSPCSPAAAGSKAACTQDQAPQLAPQLQESPSAPAAQLLGSPSSRVPPCALSARLGSAPVGALPAVFSPRALRRGPSAQQQQQQQQQLGGALPQGGVQLRKSGPLMKQRGSQEMLRLLAHAYSELVSGQCRLPPAAFCLLLLTMYEPQVTRDVMPATLPTLVFSLACAAAMPHQVLWICPQCLLGLPNAAVGRWQWRRRRRAAGQGAAEPVAGAAAEAVKERRRRHGFGAVRAPAAQPAWDQAGRRVQRACVAAGHQHRR
jgi:hypothetical protein